MRSPSFLYAVDGRVSKYRCARPSIQMVNEYLKLGYAMATFLLKTYEDGVNEPDQSILR